MQRDEQTEGKAGSPLSKEPDAGLNPRTLGSNPELKAGCLMTEPPRHPVVAPILNQTLDHVVSQPINLSLPNNPAH